MIGMTIQSNGVWSVLNELASRSPVDRNSGNGALSHV
jgi:hypothetical protein